MYSRYIKRILDIVLAGAALLILSPLILSLAAAVRIKIGKPVLFCQKRPGKNSKIFTLYKFRTMTNERDCYGNLLPDDKRLKKFGKFLRSTSLDELPSLWNILRGDLSIVGPRPQLVRDLVFMNGEQRKRHSVRQGLTGLAQVNGRNAITWEEKLAYDLKYIENITFFNDLKIIRKTIIKVWKRQEINSEGMETAEDYGDYLLRTKKISYDTYKKGIDEAKALLENNTWYYYNHALLPKLAPDEKVDLSFIEGKDAWKDKRVFFARWTEDFDCGFETAWWYCLKDDKFELEKVKAKRRYEIKKALSYFEVKVFTIEEYAESVFEVTAAAMRQYGTVDIDRKNFVRDMRAIKDAVFIGTFSKESETLCGYALCMIKRKKDGREFVKLSMVNVLPEEQKKGINAALVYGVCEEFLNKREAAYVVDGERNISHITSYQDYLQKYFQFRKAYCSLHIKYRGWMGAGVRMLFPFRKRIKGKNNRIDSILYQEEIRRSFSNGNAGEKV